MTGKDQQNGQSNNGKSINNGRKGKGAQRLANPGRLDFKRADEAFEKLVRENQEWLKEMANR
jgi:hypothetical protein